MMNFTMSVSTGIVQHGIHGEIGRGSRLLNVEELKILRIQDAMLS